MIAERSYRRAATRALLLLWGVFWLAMIVVEMQDSLLRHEGVHWWEPIVWQGSSMLMATLWLMLGRRFDARWEAYLHRPWYWVWLHLRWFPVIALTFIPAIYLIRDGVYALADMTYVHERWGFIIVYESVKLALFGGLWIAVIFGLDTFAQLRSERERLLVMQKALAEAQLRQLQSQLRPHFLFNALNTISSLMHVDPERADRLLVRLSDLLRASLQIDRGEQAQLGEELKVLEMYALVMQERFVDRVQLSWDVDPQTLEGAVPSLLLQPLLENAFRHGVETANAAVVISVRSRRVGDELHFLIANTGSLTTDARPGGIGLRNCRERLRLIHGERAGVTLTQVGEEVHARVVLPWREFEKGAA